MEWINGVLLGRLVPLLLMGSGLFFCVRLRWFFLRRPRAILRALGGKGSRRSSLRGLSLALAGTLGVGNIVGVAGAIAMGGAGAVFWMWVSAFFAMVLKYAEIVLGLRHRTYDGEGRPHGTAMEYIRAGLAGRGFPRVGKVVAAAFALLFLVNALSMGSLLQVGAVADALEEACGVAPLWVGICFFLAILWVLRRGSGGMLRLCEKLVPLMTVGYLVLSAAVLILRASAIPAALRTIFLDAFAPEAGLSGVGGFLLSRGVRYGTMRGLISNEAGCGTAPAAHATAEGVSPARQGIMGIFEVFADTLVLCTVTALVILVGVGEAGAVGENFMGITLRAYEAVLGQGAAVFLAISVVCFGFATVVCWAHYGLESARFLRDRPWCRRGFCALYALSVLAGALVSADWVWQLTDLAVGAMTLINLTSLWLLRREVAEETEKGCV